MFNSYKVILSANAYTYDDMEELKKDGIAKATPYTIILKTKPLDQLTFHKLICISKIYVSTRNQSFVEGLRKGIPVIYNTMVFNEKFFKEFIQYVKSTSLTHASSFYNDVKTTK